MSMAKDLALLAEGMAYLSAFIKAEFQTLEMLMDMKSTKTLMLGKLQNGTSDCRSIIRSLSTSSNYEVMDEKNIVRMQMKMKSLQVKVQRMEAAKG